MFKRVRKLTTVSSRRGQRLDLTARGPFRATKFFLTLSMAASGITVRPSLSMGVTSTGSHLIGTFAAAKMSLTACEISGPMPSPSIKVTAKFPYTRSACKLAAAFSPFHICQTARWTMLLTSDCFDPLNFATLSWAATA